MQGEQTPNNNKEKKEDPKQQKPITIPQAPKDETSGIFSPTICGAHPGEGVSKSPFEKEIVIDE